MGISEEDFQLYFLLALIGVFAVLSFAIFLPYIFYILGGLILVYINYPLYDKVRGLFRNDTIAASLTIVILLVLTIIPAIFLTATTAAQAQQLVEQFGTNLPQYVDTAAIESYVYDVTGQEIDLKTAIRNSLSDIRGIFSSELPGLIRTAFDTVIGLLLMGFTMYYLFKDGPAVVDAVTDIMPLKDHHKSELLEEADTMAEAILIGHLLTSAVQGIIAGMGLWAVGIPNVVFWTFVMILLGLIPVIGNVAVWGPAGLYLIFIQGQVLPGVALLLYGVVVVGLTDNLVRAKFVESRANIHPLLVLIGVIGSLPLFGLLGVVLGPLTLGFFVALLRTYSDDFWEPPAVGDNNIKTSAENNSTASD